MAVVARKNVVQVVPNRGDRFASLLLDPDPCEKCQDSASGGAPNRDVVDDVHVRLVLLRVERDQAHTASAWVRAPAGRSVKLRLRELKGGSVVRSRVVTVTGDGGWRLVLVTSATTAGGTSLSVEILASLTTSSKAQVDDVSLKRN